MKFVSIIFGSRRAFFFFSAVAIAGAAAQESCNEDDHHPENGGFFFVGVGGESDTTNLDSAHGQKLPNATWAPGYYPYGQPVVCDSEQDRYCRAPCDTEPGCEQYLSTHTCSVLLFCPPEGMTDLQAVYQLPDFAAVDSCDFSNADELGIMNGPGTEGDDGCWAYTFELDHELTKYFFASKEGCEQGQRLAVEVNDFDMTADSCITIGLTTPRIRNCDCNLQIKPSTLGEPCRTAFSDSCNDSLLIEGDCCEQGNCLSIYESYDHPEGKAKEDERQSNCDDSMPGLCYNEDGAGTDTNMMGSANCCTQVCTGCGIIDSATAQWKECTSLDAEAGTASCGFLSRYAQEAHQCDYSLCKEGDHWHMDGDAYKTAFLGETKEDAKDPEQAEPSSGDTPLQPSVPEPSVDNVPDEPSASEPSSATFLDGANVFVALLLMSLVADV